MTGVMVESTSGSNAAVNSPTSYTIPGYSTVFMISPARMKVRNVHTCEHVDIMNISVTATEAGSFRHIMTLCRMWMRYRVPQSPSKS